MNRQVGAPSRAKKDEVRSLRREQSARFAQGLERALASIEGRLAELREGLEGWRAGPLDHDELLLVIEETSPLGRELEALGRVVACLRTCANPCCEKLFYGKNPKAKFCSNQCRARVGMQKTRDSRKEKES